jgi:lysophospholipase L1-like esterase
VLLRGGGIALGALGLLEGALWLFHPLTPEPTKRLHKYLPSRSYVGVAPRMQETDPGRLSGVTPGIRTVSFNRYGFLYPIEDHARTTDDELRVAVVGGSTVECSALPVAKRWPEALEAVLATALPDRPVTVLNLGLSSQDTRTHLATMSQLVVHLEVDVVVFMLGANDLFRVGEGFDPMLGGDCYYRAPKLTRLLKQLYQKTQISLHFASWKRARKTPRTEPYFHEQVLHQASLPEAQGLRIPEAALVGYARNIVSLAALCTGHGIAPVFATTPTMLTSTPTEQELAVYWGCTTDRGRVSAESLNRLLGALNDRLVRTCAERGFEHVDLVAEIPKGLEFFYDQVHLNERGAGRVAEAVAPAVLRCLERQ